MDVGHDEEIGVAFAEYDRLVRWEEHDSTLAATDPVHERAAARGRIVSLVANLTRPEVMAAVPLVASDLPYYDEVLDVVAVLDREQLDETLLKMAAALMRMADALPSSWGSPAVCVCGHLDLDHGDDQEVDADGRPTSPRYILCFKCLEVDDSPGVYSHDFEPAPAREGGSNGD